MREIVTHNKELERIVKDQGSRKFLLNMMAALPNIVALLDEDLRLVYSNQELLDAASLSSIEDAFQLRVGELFKCVNAGKSEEGCGHSAACELCGALKAMRDSKDKQERVTQVCRILSQKRHMTTAYNFRFTSTPFFDGSNSFYVISIEDMSGSTRKEELERIFFHDLMNALNGLSGIIQLMKTGKQGSDRHLRILEEIHTNLYSTIMEQKEFSAAEKHELTVRPAEVFSDKIISNVATPFSSHSEYSATLRIDPDSDAVTLTTDPVILGRILTNMIKNALEASRKDEVVTIGYSKDQKRFWVHNPAYIPPEIRYQLFERSFTTKGTGRGLGTYSMKLLGEDYLEGKVDLHSTPEKGTTFWIELP